MANQHDFWKLNGSPVFGQIPGKVANSITPIPICLQRGTQTWGAEHIAHKHAPFIRQNSVGAALGDEVPWVIWRKLQSSGTIWSVEDPSGMKLTLPLAPSTLVVLRLNSFGHIPFFGITTLYAHNRGVDGLNLGRYVGTKSPPGAPAPTFNLPL